MNLLVNAARYTPDGGDIEVAAVHQDFVRLVVQDNGIGMTPELLQRIFNPFVQDHRASGHQYSGLGVGLALVRTLVTLHDGTVTATSRGPGLGSAVQIELPLAQGGLQPIASEALGGRETRRVRTPRRIVVVDDNADAGELLGMALSLAGHDVRVLEDPCEALDVTKDLAALMT